LDIRGATSKGRDGREGQERKQREGRGPTYKARGSGVREEREGKGVNGRDKVKAKGTVSPQNLKTEMCVCVLQKRIAFEKACSM